TKNQHQQRNKEPAPAEEQRTSKQRTSRKPAENKIWSKKSSRREHWHQQRR
ncbi:hypothetical protein Gogos_010527, partial [Gossypium gossypioides]|nr:hypothetical protein [Gossypium gossypioides]